MVKLNPVSIPKVIEKQDDPRIAHIFGMDLKPGDIPAAVLIGFPCDEGVRRNSGREGAAGGPTAIREAFYRLTPGADPSSSIFELVRRCLDWGDIQVSGSLEQDQQSLGTAVATALAQGTVPVVLGGGHESAYGHFLGYVEKQLSVEVVNLDAHPDVRALKDGQGHSGSSFRQILEHPSGLCRRYAVAGLQPHVCARAHLDYLRDKKAEAIFRRAFTPNRIESLFSKLKRNAMVSFDLDAVDDSSAPGVSAPNTGGLSVEQWLFAANAAGAHSAVTSCEIVELNPRFDVDNRTARVAALTLWHFLAGISERKEKESHPGLGFGQTK